jgi:hypothetical protein
MSLFAIFGASPLRMRKIVEGKEAFESPQWLGGPYWRPYIQADAHICNSGLGRAVTPG